MNARSTGADLVVDFADPPRLEVTVTGHYFTPLAPLGARRLLAAWEHHEGVGYVCDALQRMQAGEVFTAWPSGFQYRIRRTP